MTTTYMEPLTQSEMEDHLTDEDSFTPEQMNNFGRFVRWARKNVGMTQEELARQMDVNISYIRMLEGGRRLGTTKTYYKLGKILNQRPGKFIDVLVGDAPVPEAGAEEREDSEIEEAMNILNRLKEKRDRKSQNAQKEQSSIARRTAAQSKLALDITRSQNKSVDKHVDH